MTTPRRGIRGAIAGTLIGSLLSACNLYSGLKVGWTTSMAITGALIAYAMFAPFSPLTILETNEAQGACAASAAAASAGLVSAIPALTSLTGAELSVPALALWVTIVGLLGAVVAVPLRRAMITGAGGGERLAFPFGQATAETLERMYERGSEAISRVAVLGAFAAIAGVMKVLEQKKVTAAVPIPGKIGAASLKNLTFAIDPSLILVAIGGFMGFRASASVLLGATIAYAGIAPRLLASGIVAAGDPSKVWFKELGAWLVWPGVALMTFASLTSLAFMGRSAIRAFASLRDDEANEEGDVPRRWFWIALPVAVVAAVVAQRVLFGIAWWVGLLAVIASVALAIVGARVTGEAGLTPIGPVSKATQLMAGAIAPGDVGANLMTASVTGGATSQCAYMLTSWKTSEIIGTPARRMWIAQVVGIACGGVAGALTYRVLLPDPVHQLFTTEWPAPAAAAWKAVAQVFKTGLGALPAKSDVAIAIAAVAGVALAIAETKAPARVKRWLPSSAALGLGFVLPMNQAISLFAGGAIAGLLAKRSKRFHERYWIAICAGIIVGESLVGVGLSVAGMAK